MRSLLLILGGLAITVSTSTAAAQPQPAPGQPPPQPAAQPQPAPSGQPGAATQPGQPAPGQPATGQPATAQPAQRDPRVPTAPRRPGVPDQRQPIPQPGRYPQSQQPPQPGQAYPQPGYYPQPQRRGQPAPYGQQPYPQRTPYGQQPAPYGRQPAPYGQPPPYQQPGYGSDPGYGPPPPLLVPGEDEEEKGCCTWAVRLDPFDLLFRRATIEGELAFGDLPITGEIAASWIFDSPTAGLSESGVSVAGRVGWYVGGEPLKGFFLKAHVEYETFLATLSRDSSDNTPIGVPNAALCSADSKPGTCSKQVKSTILGLLVGNSVVFGEDGGIAISGGIGIGVALADRVDLQVDPCDAQAVQDGICTVAESPIATSIAASYYDDAARIKLLGSLSVGVIF